MKKLKNIKKKFTANGARISLLLIPLIAIFALRSSAAHKHTTSRDSKPPVATAINRTPAQTSKPAPATAPAPKVETKPTPPPAPKKVDPLPAPAKPATVTTANPAPTVAPAPASDVTGLTPATPSTDPGTPSNGSGQQTTSAYYSTNWGGYIATNGTFTSVSGAWTVPSVTGNGASTSADGSWIGIGGVTGSDLIQVGTGNTVTAGGTVTSFAFYELLPASAQIITTLPVSAGNSISANLHESSTNNWVITINNLSTGQSFSTSVSYTSSHSTAEWIQEDPSYSRNNLYPYDFFGTVVFSGCITTKNGVSMNLSESNAIPVTTVDSHGSTIASPSSVSGGTSFSVVRQ